MKPLSLVIPVADEPSNDTLELALVSAKLHAPWLRPVLVGNPLTLPQYLKPVAWTAPPALVLPFVQQHPNDPVGNTTRMLALALESELVSDPFVWSNDDIFFRAPVTLDDLRAAGATARGKLADVVKAGRYGKQALRTRETLARLLPTRTAWDYERHVPLVVNKREMRASLAVGGDSNPRSVYQNLQLEEPVAVAADVKAFTVHDLPGLEGPIFSTGARFPVAAIREALGFDTA